MSVSIGFSRNAEGELLCDALAVSEIVARVDKLSIPTPFYLYSKSKLVQNYQNWHDALATLGIPFILGYAIKANNNLAILKQLQSMGSGCVTVSDWEMRLAQFAGIPPEKIILNGTGKRMHEIEHAINAGCFVNIDSEFDLDHMSAVAAKVGKKVRAILRVNPAIDAGVHSYLATAVDTCKFGIPEKMALAILERIKANDNIDFQGFHMHLGSTIKQVHVFHDSLAALLRIVDAFESAGVPIRVINLGGGLGIDYTHKEPLPGPMDMVDAVRGLLAGRNLSIILEPGRSMVANTGVLVTRVIGVKRNGARNFVVVDGSMTEVIRPSLYDAFHFVDFASEKGLGDDIICDVVGPVCESGDFLAKDRPLKLPAEGAGDVVLGALLATHHFNPPTVAIVHDVGAYCRSMASQYNMRPMASEWWVENETLTMIRRGDTFEDLVASCLQI